MFQVIPINLRLTPEEAKAAGFHVVPIRRPTHASPDALLCSMWVRDDGRSLLSFETKIEDIKKLPYVSQRNALTRIQEIRGDLPIAREIISTDESMVEDHVY